MSRSASEGVSHRTRPLGCRGRSICLYSQRPRAAACLPLATRKFYPDFVAELTDGRTLALEHKGEVYATNDDSKEKCNVGDLWEERSNGKAIYLMTVVEKGKPSLFDQIATKIG